MLNNFLGTLLSVSLNSMILSTDEPDKYTHTHTYMSWLFHGHCIHFQARVLAGAQPHCLTCPKPLVFYKQVRVMAAL